MKKIRLVCLANSFKHKNRCFAGIQLDENNKPYSNNKWIRPISNNPNGEVSTELVKDINLLDIVEIEVSDFINTNSYQSENVYFNEESIRKIGEFDENNLFSLCDGDPSIFGTAPKAISSDYINNLRKSLMFINIKEFKIIEKYYEGRNYPQVRIGFTYNNNEYDMPITDPHFLQRYQQDPNILNGVDNLYLSLSIGLEYEGWNYKLVAGIIIQ